MNLKYAAKQFFYRFNRWRGRRNIYIDCGANQGVVLRSAIEQLNTFEFHAFEPLPDHERDLARLVKDFPSKQIHIYPQAIWTKRETVSFYISGDNKSGERVKDGSTLMRGKKPISGNAGIIDYLNPINVEAIDFAAWVKTNFRKSDYIIVKMDIEGAEYPVLRHLLDEGVVDYFNKMLIEFHRESHGQVRLESVDANEHDSLLRELVRKTRVVPWR